MAAALRVLPPSQIADALKELQMLVADPDAITAAYETARKQAALTADEQKKAEDAKTLIAKYDTLVEDILTKQTLLEQAQSDHNAQVETFKNYQAQATKALEAQKADLDEKAKRYAESLDAHAEDQRTLRLERADFATMQRATEQQLDSYKARLEKWEMTLADEQASLARERAALKDKAAQLRSILGQ